MSPYEIVAWLFVILVGAATLASALVLLLVWRGMRDERDEMYVRSRMRAALPASDERTHVRLVPDDGPADDAWLARAVHPQPRPQPYYDGGRLTDGGAR